MKTPNQGYQKINYYALLLWFVLLSACSKDSAPVTPDPINKPDPKPVPENKPPGYIGQANAAFKVTKRMTLISDWWRPNVYFLSQSQHHDRYSIQLTHLVAFVPTKIRDANYF